MTIIISGGSGDHLIRTDFREELKVRGFEGFSPESLDRYILWGLRDIARRLHWSWQQQQVEVGLNPGEAYIDLTTSMTRFRGLERVGVITSDKEVNLSSLDSRVFYESYAPHDLTGTELRGTPSSYYIWNNRLYILPPPQEATTFRVWFVEYSPEVSESEPGTYPPDLDEAILVAAEIRCHRRARQLAFAQDDEVILERMLEDFQVDEGLRDGNQQERVRGQWS